MIWWKKLLGRRSETDLVEGLRHKLDTFRDLVDNNNRVLALMAEGDEMLGGEYIFDIQCLRNLARDLREAIHRVVMDLHGVTGGRYPELAGAARRIHLDVDAIIDSRIAVPKAELAVPLADCSEELSDVVGAKMARLGALGKSQGFRIPAGFVVTTWACQRFLDKSGIERWLDDGFDAEEPMPAAQLAERSAQIRQQILGTSLPRDLARVIQEGAEKVLRASGSSSVAVRSSALGEDSELSFAGQFLTLLGVRPDALLEAYKQVVASLFAPEVMSYRQTHGLHPARGVMAVGFLEMVRARAAGVVYTLDPVEASKDVLVLSVTPGLGKTVVDGSSAVDRFELRRQSPHAVVSSAVVEKRSKLEVRPDGSVGEVEIPEADRVLSALGPSKLRDVAEMALVAERYLKCAADVEWALGPGGDLVLLQARQLRVTAQEAAPEGALADLSKRHRVLMKHQGSVACRGIGHGRVHLVADETLPGVPAGSIVVARSSSPKLAAAIAGAAAVITDVGTTTGHLATIAREAHIPTIVDAGNATQLLKPGAEVTVDAEENAVYAGRVPELLRHQLVRSAVSNDTREFRLLQRALRRVAPLTLRDPTSSAFSADACATYHDIIRFAHEKAVEELTRGDAVRPSQRGQHIRRLELPIPLDLVLVDLGGALRGGDGPATPAGVTSRPLRALLEGVLTEGVWTTEPATMDGSAFMASATRSDLTGPAASAPQQNLAIASNEYLHLNLRLGFHFTIVDCFLSDKRDSNYVYFRFAGGVTELTRRSRRAELLRIVLERHAFVVECSGDLVIGRLRKASADVMMERLVMVGKLVGFTRQLDIFMSDEKQVERWANAFLEGRYRVASG